MPIDRLDLINLKDRAISKLNSYPARCRMPDMVLNMTSEELISLAWLESSLILMVQLGYLTSDQINETLPKLYQKTQESVHDE